MRIPATIRSYNLDFAFVVTMACISGAQPGKLFSQGIGSVDSVKVDGHDPIYLRYRFTDASLDQLRSAGTIPASFLDNISGELKKKKLSEAEVTDILEKNFDGAHIRQYRYEILQATADVIPYEHFRRVWSKRENLRDDELKKGRPLFRQDEVETDKEVDAYFSVDQPQDDDLGKWQLGPDTKVKLQSHRWYWLIGWPIGNLKAHLSGKFILRRNPIIIPLSRAVFHVNVDADSLGLLVLEGSVLLSNSKGKQVVRANEYGIIQTSEAPPTKGAPFGPVWSKLNELRVWKRTHTRDLAKKGRLRRLYYTSRFANVNTGSNSPDIREPALDLTIDALSGFGQLKITVTPPN